MAREMLKLRKGDSAIMIKSNGSVELAGVNDKPLMDDKGMISPIILFAAVWAKKDQEVLNHLVHNFKNCVREGFFGPEAQSDLKGMEVEAEKNRLIAERDSASGAVTMESASGAVTMESASGAVTMESPALKNTVTPEEYDKQKREEARLEQYAGVVQDPKVLKQREKMMAGAKVVSTKQFSAHIEPDLPVEQTMAYQNATPEEQENMKKNESEKKTLDPKNPNDAAKILTNAKATPEQAPEILNNAIEKQMLDVRDGQIVGNVTIEEGVPNEN